MIAIIKLLSALWCGVFAVGNMSNPNMSAQRLTVTERYYVWENGTVKVLVYEHKHNQDYVRIELPKRTK